MLTAVFDFISYYLQQDKILSPMVAVGTKRDPCSAFFWKFLPAGHKSVPNWNLKVSFCIFLKVFVSWDWKVSLSLLFLEIPGVSRKHSRLKLKVKCQGQLFVKGSFILPPYRRRLEGHHCSKVGTRLAILRCLIGSNVRDRTIPRKWGGNFSYSWITNKNSAIVLTI
jgi:hypothetical protein